MNVKFCEIPAQIDLIVASARLVFLVRIVTGNHSMQGCRWVHHTEHVTRVRCQSCHLVVDETIVGQMLLAYTATPSE